MSSTIAILGDGGLGRAVADACRGRGLDARLLGRPATGRHDPADLAGADVVVEASRAEAVLPNVTVALDAGVRRIVIATTGWADGAAMARLDRALRDHGAAVVVAPNFSLGMALFGRLVDAAVGLFGPVVAFDPYLIEWHRRTKPDRPSGTAAALASRILAAHPRKRRIAERVEGRGPLDDELEVVSIRAGAAPGTHVVGFDAPGETVELTLAARDRSAYAAGILAAADWLLATPRAAGRHTFDTVVDDLLGETATRRPVTDPASPTLVA